MGVYNKDWVLKWGWQKEHNMHTIKLSNNGLLLLIFKEKILRVTENTLKSTFIWKNVLFWGWQGVKWIVAKCQPSKNTFPVRNYCILFMNIVVLYFKITNQA